ncbi:hypothetical protein [Blastococcus tunisiensis]|uniref:TIGR02588 family protein n=1 Tax=Blastococcus tunisiensis TaxID=1798228 RepID=A0A1I2LU44_9ACTN|nr:hypothetical protein [Blastococcus sp. DSM 46838]SFF82784.1 TIGR02588 family protein [Blastococcus sp. DSM 46838]
MSRSQDGGSRPHPAADASRGEYLLGGLGSVLIVALLAFLTYQALTPRESGPELTVTVTSIEPAPAGHAVHFRVLNSGGRTAEQVHVSGTLTRGGQQVGESTATVAYVPPESRRDGVLLFSRDPRDGDLAVAATGYVLP